MPIITYTFTCPACGQETVKQRSSTAPPPRACGIACANTLRRAEGHTTRQYHYTAAMEAAIRTAARKKYGSLRALCRDDPRFRDIPYPSVRRHAWTLGLIRSKPHGTWSAEETAFAEARYARGVPLDSLAAQMRRRGWHRSAGAILRHMQARHSARKEAWLTLNEVANGCGVDWHVVQRWITRYGLPVHHTVADRGTRAVTYFDPKAVRAWMIAHPYEVAKHAPDIVWLVGLLCPAGAGLTQDGTTPDDTDGAWLNGEAVT